MQGVQDSSAIREKLKSVFFKRDVDEKAFDLYIAPLGKTNRSDAGEGFILSSRVEEFLKHPTQQTLLVLGDSGMGKTLFSQWVAQQQWRCMEAENVRRVGKAGKFGKISKTDKDIPKTKFYCPIYIYLPTLTNKQGELKEKLLETHLEEHCGLKRKEIQMLKDEKIPLLLILDGFDEIRLSGNVYSQNQWGQWDIKLLCTCRPEALITYQNYSRYFYENKQDLKYEDIFAEVYLCSFNEQQRDKYLEAFIYQQRKDQGSEKQVDEEQWQSVEMYRKYIDSLPGLKSLAETPFILSMLAQTLPRIVKKLAMLSKDKVIVVPQKKSAAVNKSSVLVVPSEVVSETAHLTRAELYREFTELWFERQARRLHRNKVLPMLRGDLTQYLKTYAKNLALARLTEGKLETAIAVEDTQQLYLLRPVEPSLLEYYEKYDRKELESAVLEIRSGCLLQTQGQGFRFLHKSILEYLAAEELFKGVMGLIDVQTHFVLTGLQKREDTFQTQILVDEPQILARLAELAQKNPAFKEALWQLVEYSKQDERFSIAAANAITVWRCASFPLYQKDLRNARIPRADLNHTFLANTDFSGADLTGVRLYGSNLSSVNFKDANLTGVQLGRLPKLEIKTGVCCCSYSPDGKRFVVGDRKGHIHVYDTETWNCVKRLDNWSFKRTGLKDNAVWSVAWSADNTYVAAGSEDNAVYLWNMKNYKRMEILTGHTKAVDCLSFSLNGQWLASGGEDTTIRVWDMVTKKIRAVFEGRAGAVFCVKFSPDGKLLASVTSKSFKDYSIALICLWDMETNQPRYVCGEQGSLYSCDISPDLKLVVLGCTDKTIRLLDIETQRVCAALEGHTEDVHDVCFSPDGKLLASGGGYDRTVRLWGIQTLQVRAILESSDVANYIRFSPDGQQLVSIQTDMKSVSHGSADIYLWDLKANQLEQSAQKSVVSLRRAQFSHDGKLLMFKDHDYGSDLFLSDVLTQKINKIPALNHVKSFCFSSDGQSLIVSYGYSSKEVEFYLYDLKTSNLRKIVEKYMGYGLVDSIALSSDGEWLAIGCHYKQIEILNLKTQEIYPLKGHHKHDYRVTFSPDGRWLASDEREESFWRGTQLYSVLLWDLKTRKFHKRLKGGGTNFSFSFDGQYIISGNWSGVKLWDVQSGTCLAQLGLCLNKSLAALQFVMSLPNCIYVACGNGTIIKLLWEPYERKLEIISCSQNSSVRLDCESVQLNECFGLSENNLKVMKQLDAIGNPSQAQVWSRGVRSTLFQSAKPANQPAKNILGGNVILNQFFGAVSIVRSKDGNHAFFLIEVNTTRGIQVSFADLTTPSSVLEQSSSQAKAIIKFELWRDDANYSKLREKVRNELIYRTVQVPLAKLEALCSDIEGDKRKTIYYSMVGDRFFSIGNREYQNCLTWCLAKLDTIGIKFDNNTGWSAIDPKSFLPKVNIEEAQSSSNRK